MNILWHLCKKDLLRHWRSPLGVIVMLVFPLLFSGLIALAFGGGDTGLPRVRLLVEDLDRGLAGRAVAAAFGAEQLTPYLEAIPVGSEGMARLEAGEASALLRIPALATERLLAGEAVTFELIRNPTQGILPEIAEQMSATMTDLLSLAAGMLQSTQRQLGVQSLEELGQLDEAALGRAAMQLRRLSSAVLRFGGELPLAIEQIKVDATGRPVEKKGVDPDEPSQRLLIFTLVLPGVMMFSLFAIGDQLMRDLLHERTRRTLQRQLCAPLTLGQVVLGKLLVAMLVSGLALVLLMGIAAALLRRWLDPFAFLALTVVVVLAVAGAAAAIYGLARTERQGAAFANMLYLILAFTGGSFIPLDTLPSALRSIAPFSPFYWGNQGFQALLRGDGLSSITQPLGVLFLLGATTLGLGIWWIQGRTLEGNT